MKRLSADDAEEAAGVIERLFADLRDLRQNRSAKAEIMNVGSRTNDAHARVVLLRLLHTATEGNLVDMTEDEARDLYLSLHLNPATGYERGDCHCDHCDNALGELVLFLEINFQPGAVYCPAKEVRRQAEERGWLVGAADSVGR